MRWDLMRFDEMWWDDMTQDEIEWYYTKSSNVVQYSIIWIFLKITVYWKKSEKMRSVKCTPDFTISNGFWSLDGGKNCWQVGHFLENFVDKEQDMNIMMKDKILIKFLRKWPTCHQSLPPSRLQKPLDIVKSGVHFTDLIFSLFFQYTVIFKKIQVILYCTTLFDFVQYYLISSRVISSHHLSSSHLVASHLITFHLITSHQISIHLIISYTHAKDLPPISSLNYALLLSSHLWKCQFVLEPHYKKVSGMKFSPSSFNLKNSQNTRMIASDFHQIWKMRENWTKKNNKHKKY